MSGHWISIFLPLIKCDKEYFTREKVLAGGTKAG